MKFPLHMMTIMPRLLIIIGDFSETAGKFFEQFKTSKYDAHHNTSRMVYLCTKADCLHHSAKDMPPPLRQAKELVP